MCWRFRQLTARLNCAQLRSTIANVGNEVLDEARYRVALALMKADQWVSAEVAFKAAIRCGVAVAVEPEPKRSAGFSADQRATFRQVCVSRLAHVCCMVL